MESTAFASASSVTVKPVAQLHASVVNLHSARNGTARRTVVLRRTALLPTRAHDALCACTSCTPASRTNTRMALALSTGQQVLADLMIENAAFVRGEAKIFPGVPEERYRLATEGQTPKIAIIACADSRVAPEILFRANVGELFVIRAAGNTVWGNEVLGSLEFAVNVLKVSAVMVLGHTKCGAVAAAVSGGKLPGALGAHIHNISQGLAKQGCSGRDVDAAVHLNVKAALDYLRKDPKGVVPLAEKNGLVVCGGVYDISTGAVKLV